MDFPPMMNNSALMQSYNLMKMSSEVTSKQSSAQVPSQMPHLYSKPDYQNDYYAKPNYNMGMYQQMKTQPPPRQMHMEREEPDDFPEDFLGNFLLELILMILI